MRLNSCLFVCLFVLINSLVSFRVDALEINKMLSFFEEGYTTFTIKNSEDKRIFVNTAISKVEFKDGGINKVNYTRDNIDDWEVNITPSRAIIEPGFEKDFRVSLNCATLCNNESDQVFQISFVPVPFKGEQEDSLVQIAIGFGPYIIHMGKENTESFNYTVDYEDNNINFYNKTPNFLRVNASFCDIENVEECSVSFIVFGGRQLSYSLPPNMQKDQLTLTVSDAKSLITEKVTVLRN